MKKYHVGIFGLGVMGRNFAKNFLSKGFLVGVYNKEKEFVEKFLVENQGNQNLAGFFDIEEFVNSLEKPRKIILMITAGQAVDDVINILMKYLEPGDIIVDGGNSHFKDTERRYDYLKSLGIRFIGMGISGGTEGALNGPALMPGGDLEAYKIIEPLLIKVAAHSKYGPCVAFVGKRSAGHFVKMIHNGIEYGLIESIAEIYDLLRNVYNLTPLEISELFDSWSSEPFGGFLLSASSNVLKIIDKEQNVPLVDRILDVAGQKGTGLWSAQTALEFDVPTFIINSSLLVRFASIYKDLRTKLFEKSRFKNNVNQGFFNKLDLNILKEALTFTWVLSFVEGLWMLHLLAQKLDYDVSLDVVLRIWRKGSIVESNILDDLIINYSRENSGCLLEIDVINDMLNHTVESAIEVSLLSKKYGLSVPTIDAAINEYFILSRAELPASFIQILRDYFGHHGFLLRDLRDKISHIKDF